jgi:hypothetical protein
MRNLTLAIDEDILLEARKLALERNTTVNQLVRDYLEDFTRQHGRRKAALERLKSRMQKGILRMGTKTWSRDGIHAR